MQTKTDRRERGERAALIVMTAISLSWFLATVVAIASNADDLLVHLLTLAIIAGVNLVMALEYGFLRRFDALAILAGGSHEPLQSRLLPVRRLGRPPPASSVGPTRTTT